MSLAYYKTVISRLPLNSNSPLQVQIDRKIKMYCKPDNDVRVVSKLIAMYIILIVVKLSIRAPDLRYLK